MAAAKRWIKQNAQTYKHLGITMLGDDLYCKHPLYVVKLIDDNATQMIAEHESIIVEAVCGLIIFKGA